MDGHPQICEQNSAPRLLDLPGHILDAVFCTALRLHLAALSVGDDALELRKRDPRRVLPLVSRGFLAATAEADSLWRRVQLNLLTLSAERVPRLVRWLAAHAPALRCLVLYGRALPAVEAALAGQVAELAAAVQRAGEAGLEQLDLPRSLGTSVLARLTPQQLTRLRAVSVDLSSSNSRGGSSSTNSSSRGGGAGGGGGCGSSSGGSLRERRGGGAEGRQGGELSEVEQATLNLLLLPALQELLMQCCLEARLLAAHPAAWPQLRRLHLADVRDVPRGPALGPLASLQGALSSLRFYQRDGFRLPGPLTALRQLAHLHAAVRYQDDPLLVGPELSCLASLQALWLQHAVFEAPASLAALPRLHTLALVGCAAGWAAVLHGLGLGPAAATAAAAEAGEAGSGPAAAAAAPAAAGASSLLGAPAPAPRLRALHLEAHAMTVAEVPAEAWGRLAQLPGGLTRLELPYNRLRELPPGPYLSSLQVLDLSQNSLTCVPPSLAACPRLHTLSVGQQEAAALGESDADVALLCALPALRLLVASSGHYSGAHLAAGLRSPAEAAFLGRLRAALPLRVRVTNRQAEWERAAGRLAALFEVSLRQGRV